MPRFAIHVNSGHATFVKTYDFFVAQGGLKEPWGKHWKIIEAKDIHDARRITIAEPNARSGLYCAKCGHEDLTCVCEGRIPTRKETGDK